MKRLLPSLLSALRLLAAVPLFFAVRRGAWDAALGCLGFACASDALDGPLARRWRAATGAGAWLDVSADFAVVLAGTSALALRGTYPVWVPLVAAGMFAQFVATSRRRRPVYDPAGRYYGAALFAAIGVTLVVQDAGIHALLLGAIAALTAASLASRIASRTPRPRGTAAAEPLTRPP